MKFLSLFLFLFSLTFGTYAQSVEDDVLEQLNISFKKEGLNLTGLIEKYEAALIEDGKLEDASIESWHKLLKLLCAKGIIMHPSDGNLVALELEFQLSMHHFGNAIQTVQSTNKTALSKSELGTFLNKYPQPIHNPQPELTYLLQNINALSESMQQHKLFKPLLVLIVANFANVSSRTNDRIIQSESDYARWLRASGGTMPLFEERNICSIRANALGELMINRERVDSLRDMKATINNFLALNRSLTLDETKDKIKDHTYEGYNYPFFSHVTKLEVDQQIELINAQLDTISNNPRSKKILLWTRELWIEKKHFHHTLGNTFLKEIHSQAHFRIQDNSGTADYVDMILVPILETVSELRNEECQAVFGESFEVVSQRNNFLMGDHYKLRYLENQFPLFILVNPNRHLNQGPPPQEMLPPPPQEVIVIEKND